MPIHSLGYREWTGPLSSAESRWTVIAWIGVRRAWQSMWLRRIVFFSWVPGVLMALLIYLFEQAASEGQAGTFISSGMVRFFLEGGERRSLQESLAASQGVSQDLVKYRHEFWCSLLQVLYQRSQAIMLIPVIGITAPPLISQDMRSRAFLLYFSRPISRTQYICGKAASVACYVLLISLLPGMMLYCTGVLLSPEISIVLDTWDIPLRVLAATATMVIPTTCIGLMLSSLTTETRFASFAWFSVWVFGFFSYFVTSSFTSFGSDTPGQMLSLFHVISRVQEWLLDIRPETQIEVAAPVAVLFGVTVLSLAVLYRRVSSPLSV
ncbi:MAG: ABC transporter permease [Fuerstiella sp.]|nr:ABC transporter permease [Fuerstiella sp.]